MLTAVESAVPKKPVAIVKPAALAGAAKKTLVKKAVAKKSTRIFTPVGVSTPAQKLREVPQAVYTRLNQAAAPLTAYDLIDSVQKQLNRRLHPPTIYRALSQLVERGLVHRLESGSSYIACASPGEPHHSILFVCAQCGTAEEAVDNRVHSLLQEDAKQRGFSAESEVIEVRGLCRNCRKAN
ncbi:MAG: transcriptional regulator [Nevskia sp.]|nr:transcriptional regulator [Nevskia sp.]